MRRGFTLAYSCYLCLEDESGPSSAPLYKDENLWALLFSLFGTTWVIFGTVKDTLLR